MIERTTKLKVLAFLVVSILGVSYVGVRYVGLGDRLLGGGYVVHVDLARAGGIFPNAPVTYRGVSVGRVGAVSLRGDGVRADLRLGRGVRVPSDLRAVVSQRSAVGEQYLDLRPEREEGPYLRDGSVIPRDRTGVPLAPETLLANLDALVRSVNPADLTVLITELGTAFEGNELALGRILDAGDALLADATATLPETLALIRDGRTVLTTQAESAEALRRWSAGLAQLAETVRAADPDLRRLLAAGPPAGAELVALLRGLDPSIGTLLGNLVTVNGIAARRLPGIEQMLVVYPMAVAGGFTVTPGDGTVHLGLVVNASDPPACVYRTAQGCAASDEARGSGVRGAQNAPRPGG
ncbi:MCE family protein, partial [Micromonospora sp. NPDC049679]|uniref:MCE family protein n=1 Tax=Micromonospora sp. NPDC049679 TaxID=3155920 RepID=UPI0033EFCAC2